MTALPRGLNQLRPVTPTMLVVVMEVVVRVVEEEVEEEEETVVGVDSLAEAVARDPEEEAVARSDPLS